MNDPIFAYAREKQIELSKLVLGRFKIYLDTKFWILLRETKTPTSTELIRLLHTGKNCGRLICPVSASTVIEVAKQKNTSSRRIGSARLIDELSLGVTLLPSEQRAATEFAHFLSKFNGSCNLYEVRELIWTKIPYALGYLFPTNSELSADENFSFQKYFVDTLWNLSLTDFFGRLSEEKIGWDQQRSQESARRLSADIHHHSSEIKSYQQVYIDEVAGAVDLLGDEFAGFAVYQARKDGRRAPVRDSEEWREAKRLCCNMVGNLLRLSPKARFWFPTIHVEASLHAALRWNKGRNFKANDFFDFEHAVSALAYCDTFFTEKSLCHLVTAKNTNLQEVNGCSVTANLDEAVSIVSNLLY